jgi:hypothetical protein
MPRRALATAVGDFCGALTSVFASRLTGTR